MAIQPPIFVCGPHGSGKSTLIKTLVESSSLFLESDFDIDFTIDFPSMTFLSSFERSLVRIYHRFFIASYAADLAKKNPEKFILTNRTVYDSEAYINTYKKLGWISEEEFKKLNFVLKNFSPPNAIILNPTLETVKKRIEYSKRATKKPRREELFKNEDSNDFLEPLRDYFQKFKGRPKILYIEDNGEKEVKQVIEWVKKI